MKIISGKTSDTKNDAINVVSYIHKYLNIVLLINHYKCWIPSENDGRKTNVEMK
jgi:hypothetical protein